MMTPNDRAWPAEWAPHEATWLSWPHNQDDWPGKFEPAEWAYVEIVRHVAGRESGPGERVEILCRDERLREHARSRCEAAHVRMDRVRFHLCPSDRGWMRDAAPTFVRRGSTLELIDWRFNGWAKYDNWRLDDLIPAFVETVARGPRTEAARPDDGSRLVLEGGAIDGDGQGRVLVTEECLLHPSVQVRNPGLTREGYERALREYLGASQVVWLEAGCVGDDTHGHIDDVARFAPPIAGKPVAILAFEDDPKDENHASSLENERRLGEAGVHVVTIPYPSPVLFEGQRLPASYANFYACNAAVLVPTFNDANDRVALDTIAGLFPDRPTIGVHCLDLVWGLGTIHCLTQQQPA